MKGTVALLATSLVGSGICKGNKTYPSPASNKPQFFGQPGCNQSDQTVPYMNNTKGTIIG
jgi:hypothetical protein